MRDGKVEEPLGGRPPGAQDASIEATDLGLNALPRPLRWPRAASSTAMALQRPLAPVDRIARQLLRQHDHRRVALGVALAAAALARVAPSCDRGRLGAWRPASPSRTATRCRGSAGSCTAVGVSSRKPSGLSAAISVTPSVAQQAPAGLLHDQVAGEAGGGLDDDRPDAIAGDAFEHGGEAGPLIDRVGAVHAVVAVLVDELVAVAPWRMPRRPRAGA